MNLESAVLHMIRAHWPILISNLQSAPGFSVVTDFRHTRALAAKMTLPLVELNGVELALLRSSLAGTHSGDTAESAAALLSGDVDASVLNDVGLSRIDFGESETRAAGFDFNQVDACTLLAFERSACCAALQIYEEA